MKHPRAIKASFARRLVQTLGVSVVVFATVAQPAFGAVKPRAAVSHAQKHGGSLTVTLGGDTASFDPDYQEITQSYDSQMGSALYGMLAYENPDNGNVIDMEAQSITPSPGNKLWTVVLHAGMKFSDGTPFNAAAVKFNIQRDAEPSYGSTLEPLASTLKMNVLSATTLQFILPSPNSQFNAVIAEDFPFIGSPTAEKAEGLNFLNNPVGAGPFEIQSRTYTISTTMIRNPYYSLFAKGQPYLNKLTFLDLRNAPQQEAAMQSGEAQMDSFDASKPQITEEQQAGFSIIEHTPGGGGYLMMNDSIAPFNNYLAREAIWYALNRSEIANTKSPGTGVAPGLFPKKSQWYDPQWAYPQQNAAKAQQLLNQYAQQNGGPLTFVIKTTTAAQQQINVADTMAELSAYQNVKVTETITQSSNADERASNFQMITFSAYYNNPIPGLLDNFDGVTGTLDFTKWNDPKVNAALLNFEATSSPVQQKKDVDTVEEAFYNDLPTYMDSSDIMTLAYAPKYVYGPSLHTVQFGLMPLWAEVSLVNPAA